MNLLRMRPGYIVWGGFLHVWVNKRFWCQTPGMDDDMQHALMAFLLCWSCSVRTRPTMTSCVVRFRHRMRVWWHGRTSATRVSRCRATRAARTTSLCEAASQRYDSPRRNGAAAGQAPNARRSARAGTDVGDG